MRPYGFRIRPLAGWERPFADGLRTMQKRGELSRREKPDRLATTIVATLQGAYRDAGVR